MQKEVDAIGMDFSWLNLRKMSMADLIKLEGLITQEYSRREALKLANEDKNPSQSSVERVLAQISVAQRPIRRAKQIVQVKSGTARYQHPSLPTLQWTGLGRRPNWLRDWLENGGTLEQLQHTSATTPSA